MNAKYEITCTQSYGTAVIRRNGLIVASAQAEHMHTALYYALAFVRTARRARGLGLDTGTLVVTGVVGGRLNERRMGRAVSVDPDRLGEY